MRLGQPYLRGVLEVLLVRHGQSEWNALGRWQGRADPPLTELGRVQARHAAAALPQVDLLASSTLQRARQTAAEISAILGITEVVTDAGFVERDAGAFSGLTKDEIEQQFPGYLQNGQRPAGWEDDDVLVDRVRRALEGLHHHRARGTVVTIAHGGVIYALEALFGIPHERIGNLGGRWFTSAPDGGLDIGERVHLLDAAEETVPDQL